MKTNISIIRITSEKEFLKLNPDMQYQDILEICFGDISIEEFEKNKDSFQSHFSDNIENIKPISQEIVKTIHKFVLEQIKNNIEYLIIHCDAGISRSPAVAISIADYILEDHEQAKAIALNKLYRPNATVLSAFSTYFKNNQ